MHVISRFAVAILLAAAVMTTNRAAVAEDVADTALVLAVDISRSVDETRYRLQMEGIAQALDDPEVVRVITSGARRAILLTLVGWADRARVLLLRVARTTSLPAALLSAPQVRTVHIPATSRDVRHAYARTRSQTLAERCGVSPDAVAQTLSDITDDWTLDQVDALVQTAERQNITDLHDIEELARAAAPPRSRCWATAPSSCVAAAR